MASPLQATSCGDTTPLVRGLAPLKPRTEWSDFLKKDMCEIKVRMPRSSLIDLNQKAKKAGLSREEYCRKLFQESIVHEAPPADILLFLREIRRVGININQILLIAQAKNMILVPDLRKALDDLFQLEVLVIDTYRPDTKRRHKK